MIGTKRVETCIAIDGPCTGRKWDTQAIEVNKTFTIGSKEFRYRMSGDYKDGAIVYVYVTPADINDPPGTSNRPL